MKRNSVSVAMLAAGAGLLVAAALAAPQRSAVRDGGTFRIGLADDGGPIDPAFGNFVHTNITCAKLFNFADQAQAKVVPEVAVGYPKVSRDGKVYTFTLRTGFRFNTGEKLTARHFAYAINRTLLMPPGPGQFYVDEVVGSDAVREGRSQTASGVVARANRLIVRLTRRVPDLAFRMAYPSFCAIPTNLPVDPEGVGAPLPSAGPYYVARWAPGRELVLNRNPRYGGKRRRHVDRFVFTFEEDLETIRRKIESGQLETGDVPPTAHGELFRRYGINKSQYFVRPTQFKVFLVFNSEGRLFASARLRRAVNFVVDRSAIVAAGARVSGHPRFGPQWATASDQMLFPYGGGYRPGSIYPLRGGNVRRAQALAKGLVRNSTAVLYTRNSEPWFSWAQIAQANLKKIGIAVKIEAFPPDVHRRKTNDPREPWDLSFVIFGADLPDPYYVINYLFDVPGSYFSRRYPSYIRTMRRAARLTGDARLRAYAKLDHSLVRDVAPGAVLAQLNHRTLVSRRVGCKVLYPELDLTVACLKW